MKGNRFAMANEVAGGTRRKLLLSIVHQDSIDGKMSAKIKNPFNGRSNKGGQVNRGHRSWHVKGYQKLCPN
jgi:hypothetical protein